MIHFNRKHLSNEQLISLYQQMLYPRLIEEKMLLLLRQGRISKWFSGIGQEAVSVGASAAMQGDEWILPLHRNLGVFTTRNMPLDKLFMQWQGYQAGYTGGRERSFHFGDREYHICGMISHLGPQLSVADGIALAGKLKKEAKATLAFTGEGGTSEGEFHEALNVASVWDLPVIFLIENNGYGLSTPVSEQYRCDKLSDRAAGYGMEGLTIDGNNILEVFHTIQHAREYAAREQKPILIECMTFRMRGHEEASGTQYIPRELFEKWAKKDPVLNYEAFLTAEGVLSQEQVNDNRRALKEKIEQAIKAGAEDPAVIPDTSKELQDVYAHPVSVHRLPAGKAETAVVQQARPVEEARRDDHPPPTTDGPRQHIRFINAISNALRQAMQKHDNLILMGQDIAAYGGAFKITEGFVKTFGKERVRNTPLCESAIVGAALGLSLEGYKSVMEMQFADFVSCGFNQIINNLAKIHYRWGQNADVVIRMPTGAGVNAGPFHSQSNEAWFVHTPGLKVVYPAAPYDAKGLLLAAIEDPDPVLYFEHKALYRSISAPVPDDYYTVEIGKAKTILEGNEAAIITYGMGVQWALRYAETHPDTSINILDLRTLSPLDHDAIYTTVKNTGKVLVLHEDVLTGGIGGEIAAWIGEHCFELLDAPVMRCGSLDTPVPFAEELEQQFLANSRLDGQMELLLNY